MLSSSDETLTFDPQKVFRDTHFEVKGMLCGLKQIYIFILITDSHYRLSGPMARRLTTNQEIPGSTPYVAHQ